MRQIRIAAMALGLALALVACGATVQDPNHPHQPRPATGCS